MVRARAPPLLSLRPQKAIHLASYIKLEDSMDQEFIQEILAATAKLIAEVDLETGDDASQLSDLADGSASQEWETLTPSKW